MITALIIAGGVGSRMGVEISKWFSRLWKSHRNVTLAKE